MFQMRTSIISVVVDVLGRIRKGSDRHIEGILGRPCLKEIQKNDTHKYNLHITKTFIDVKYVDLKFCFFTKMISEKYHKDISNLRSRAETRKEI